MNTTSGINSFLDRIYKNYSVYVLQNRAIPHIFSGLKTSQKKMLFVASKRARSAIKTAALTGFVLAEAQYHHGDQSMSALISKMAQDFKGGNNMPLFEGEGAFGTHLEPDGIAAPRYTTVKLSPAFDKIFKPIDMRIAPKNPDPECPEPATLVPTIPYALVNGISGIAVGYATKILPYNVDDICEQIRASLDGKSKRKRMVPFFRGYKGHVFRDEDGKINMVGCFERKGRRLVVTEVPVTESLSSYIAFLNKLEEKGKINGFTDRSREDWEIEIEVSRETLHLDDSAVLDLLGLKAKLSENLNFIDFDGKVKHYNTAEEYIADFVKIRMMFYEERKAFVLRTMDEEILELSCKIAMNEHVKQSKKRVDPEIATDYVLSVLSGTRDPLKKLSDSVLSVENTKDIARSVIRSISFVGLSDEATEKNKETLKEKLLAREIYFKTSTRDIYEEDLKDIEKHWRLLHR